MIYIESKDFLAKFARDIKFGEINQARDELSKNLQGKRWARVRELFNLLPFKGSFSVGELELNLNESVIKIGKAENLNSEEYKILEELIQQLMPWRKGPFSLFGIEIDAEWRSEKKWDRLLPYLDELKGKRVADVGCNNGYYMFRASKHQPELVIGLDPSEQFYYSFELMQRFIQHEHLTYQMLGVQHLPLFPKFFDVVLCLGIIYHQKHPLEMLRWLKAGMKPGAQLIIESLAIPGNDSLVFSPGERYCKMRNISFVPSATSLAGLIKQAGFEKVEIFSEVKLEIGEQRKTEFMKFESLEDFLDPGDRSKTVEGYPAPWRVGVRGRVKTVRTKKERLLGSIQPSR